MIQAVLAGAVLAGLDAVEAAGGAPLRGRRVGLVAHAASVALDGRHALDVLQARGALVSRLFAPEHGWRSRAAAGEAVADGREAGLPVVSLHGTRQAPTREDLRGLDALVVDLQDAGVRFYTYASTLLLCFEAAADAGVELVVLDRPNPLGGVLVEGPEADATTARSLLSLAPGPLIHGLTLGELARLAAHRSPRPARVTVVPMRGWRRSMRWVDTGRVWTAPSPNLRSSEAALVYPGTALLEATSLSEGRGTETPFLLFGAPGLDAVSLARGVDAAAFGLSLELAEFTPRSGEADPAPKHRDALCHGLRLSVRSSEALRPYAFGLNLLRAARAQRGFEWRGEGVALDALLGTRRVREALERGESADAILAKDAAAVERFRRERERALLY
ncbi:MAG TPA: DUF1343 domain-containing protein [Vicinamibacteria bacterium]|nr:DUF1343 domain-containing protein [Vicinamibacteria bacterium]